VGPAQGLDGGVPNEYQYGAQPGYGAPPWQTPTQPGYATPPWQTPVQTTETMTLEDVLQKTAISLGALFLVAAAAYMFLPDIILIPAMVVGGLCAFIAPFIVARRRVASPAANIFYAATEGILIGAVSKIFEYYYPGIIVQAVLATMIAAGVVLVAYRFGGFRVSSRASKLVRTGMIAFISVALVNLVLSFFNVNLGLFPAPGQPVTWLAWGFALIGVCLAVFSLVEDFQFIEAGIAAGAPRDKGWVAAFGLSVTMVWLYINLLRILSYIRR